MCQMCKKEYVVYSKRIMYKLRDRGFIYDYSRPNLKKPQYDCYIYKWSPALQEALDNIYEEGK